MRFVVTVSRPRIGCRVKVQTPNPNQPDHLMTLGVLQMNTAHAEALVALLKEGSKSTRDFVDVVRSTER